MLDILKAAAAESEEQSDQIAEDFLDSKLAIDEFLDQFKTSRIEMHLRKLKSEKMQELLRRGSGQPQQNTNYPPGMSNFYGQPAPGPLPYPTRMPGYPMMPSMPMPPNYRPPF
jgi:ESCRT-I complex subunit VPS37